MPTVLTDHAALGGDHAYGSFASLYANSVMRLRRSNSASSPAFALGVLMLLLDDQASSVEVGRIGEKTRVSFCVSACDARVRRLYFGCLKGR